MVCFTLYCERAKHKITHKIFKIKHNYYIYTTTVNTNKINGYI